MKAFLVINIPIKINVRINVYIYKENKKNNKIFII